MSRTRATLLALVAVTALLTAACGGGDSETTAGASDTTAGGSSGVTTPDVKVGGGFDGSLEDCTQLASAFVAITGIPMMGMLGGDAVAEVEEALADLDARVPSALAGEFATVKAAYDEYIETMDGATMADMINDPSVAEKFEQAAAAFDNPEVEEATTTIGKFLEDNCAAYGYDDLTP
jgi:hypothetical protein